MKSTAVDPRLGGEQARVGSASHALVWLLGAGVLLIATVAHLLVLPAAQTATGPLVIVDRLFDLIAAGVVLLAGLAVGGSIMQRVPVKTSAAESLVLATGLGLGLLMSTVFLLGLAGLFRAPVLIALLAVCIVAGWPSLVAAGRDLKAVWLALAPARPPLASIVYVVPIVAALLLTVLLALTPVAQPDAVAYHLGLPRVYLAEGRIAFHPELIGDGLTLGLEMLYAICLALGSESAARLLHVAFMLLAVAAVALLTARWAGRRAALWAVLAALTLPISLRLASWAYIDWGSVFYHVLAVDAVLLWAEQRRSAWIVLAGVWAGCAAVAKLLALYLLPAVAPLVLWVLWRDRRDLLPRLAPLIAAGVIALALLAPWFGRNWLWAGHPLYPVYQGDALEVVQRITAVNERGGDLTAGVQQSALNTLLLPAYVLIYPERFTHGHAPTAFGAILVLVPIALVLRLPRPFYWLLGIGALTFLLWSIKLQEARYFLAGSLLLAAVVGAVIATLLDRLRLPLARALLQVVLAALAWSALVEPVDAALTEGELIAGPDRVEGPWARLAGVESRREFLAERWLGYGPLVAADQLMPADGAILLVRLWVGEFYRADFSHAFVEDHAQWPSWLLPGVQGWAYPERRGDRWITAHAPTFEAAIRRAKAEGITHIALGRVVRSDPALARTSYPAAAEAQFAAFRQAIDAELLAPVHDERTAIVFEIR